MGGGGWGVGGGVWGVGSFVFAAVVYSYIPF